MRRVGLLAAGLAALLLPGAGALEAAQRPRVVISFAAGIPQFSGLTEQERRGLGAHVVEHVRGKCLTNWPFIDWAASSGTGEAPAGDSVWQVRVRGESHSVSRPGKPPVIESLVRLQHFVRSAGATAEQELQAGETKLYDYSDFKPTAADTLQRDMDRLLERQFDREFLGLVWEQLVSEIPIADRVVLDPAAERVIIPLLRSDLQAKEESQVKATFMRSTDAGALQEGKLLLEASEAVRQGDCVGCISGLVLKLESRPFFFKEVFWDPRLVEIFRSAFDVRVFMFTYVKDPAAGARTSEGLILDPDANGGVQ